MIGPGHLVAGLVCLILAGCGGDEPPPPETYAQPTYDYLPKLRLNVGSVDVVDHAQPVGPRDIAASAPVVPAQALTQMAHDRLFAASLAGSAHFVIDQASLVREPNGTLDGDLAVHLDLTTPAGTQGGYAAARVARQHLPGSDPENEQNEEYRLVKQMMGDMNVELEFQIRRSLANYLVTGQAVPAAVMAQPLGPAPPPSAPSQGIKQEPPANGYQDPMAPPEPPQLSPQPGYLQPPPGVAPSTGY